MADAGDPRHELRAALRRLHADSGLPSHEDLRLQADFLGRSLPKSTTNDLLNGRHVARWRTIESFVLACRRHARARVVPADLAEWRRLHDAASKASLDDDAAWYFASCRAWLDVSGDSPWAIEERTVVCLAGSVREFRVPMSLPRADGGGTERDVAARVLFGGELVRTEHPSGSQFALVIRLPVALTAGETHSYLLRLGIPADQRMKPVFGYSPLQRCDRFELVAKFPAAAPPRHIRLLSGRPVLSYEDEDSVDEVTPDACGEVRLAYDKPRIGFVYGISWTA